MCLDLPWGGPGRRFNRCDPREPHPFCKVGGIPCWNLRQAEKEKRGGGVDGHCPGGLLPDLLADPIILAGNPDNLFFVKPGNDSIRLAVCGENPSRQCV